MITALCHAETQRNKKICLLSGQVHKVQGRVWGSCAVLGRSTGKFLARKLAVTKAQMESSTVNEVFHL